VSPIPALEACERIRRYIKHEKRKDMPALLSETSMQK
jgi:hypothetical protein